MQGRGGGGQTSYFFLIFSRIKRLEAEGLFQRGWMKPAWLAVIAKEVVYPAYFRGKQPDTCITKLNSKRKYDQHCI